MKASGSQVEVHLVLWYIERGASESNTVKYEAQSISAQYIFQDMVNRWGLASEFVIDSAATSTEEIGNAIYPPMKSALERMGVPVGTHRARQMSSG